MCVVYPYRKENYGGKRVWLKVPYACTAHDPVYIKFTLLKHKPGKLCDNNRVNLQVGTFAHTIHFGPGQLTTSPLTTLIFMFFFTLTLC